ncbi:hypothetical protein GYMLUDRAFT_240584 [Collybiopsis luxurians FD-317 M1]|nr:hypothetical protein GYMLUDRAFT_240584 [Collybiopsis luxurians FD-317 M1]
MLVVYTGHMGKIDIFFVDDLKCKYQKNQCTLTCFDDTKTWSTYRRQNVVSIERFVVVWRAWSLSAVSRTNASIYPTTRHTDEVVVMSDEEFTLAVKVEQHTKAILIPSAVGPIGSLGQYLLILR